MTEVRWHPPGKYTISPITCDVTVRFIESFCTLLYRMVHLPLSAVCMVYQKFTTNAALLWQKEASDIPSKSELLMFSYFTYIVCSSSRPNLYASTLILLREMLGKASWYAIAVSGNDRHILLFYKKFHFCHLLPFAKVGQNVSLLDQ